MPFSFIPSKVILFCRSLTLILASSLPIAGLSQDPGCIGFGSNPQNCVIGCAGEAFLCPGLDSILIKECQAGTCAAGNLSYCWMRRRPGENDFSQIPGATGKDYQVTAADLEGKTGVFLFRRALRCGGTCLDSLYDEVTLLVSALKVTAAATPSDLCRGSSTSLEAVVTGGIMPFNFAWSNNLSPNAKVSATPDTTTTYTVTVSDSTNCVVNSSVKVSVFPKSIGGFAIGGLDSICAGGNTGTIQLTGQTGGVIQWLRRHNKGSWDIASTKNTHSENLQAEGEWEFKAVVKSGPCDTVHSSIRTIVVISKPTSPTLVPAFPDPTVCEGALLKANMSGGSGGLGTCMNESYGSHASNSWFPLNPQDPNFNALLGNNAILGLRRCSVSGCTSADTARVQWLAVKDPIVSEQPTSVDKVCFLGSSGPINLKAEGGTPSLSYAWYYEDPNSGWIPVSNGNPSNAQYDGKDKANGFIVSGINLAGTYRFRARVSAAGKGCDATDSQPVTMTWRPKLDPSYTFDPLNISEVGKNWKFTLNIPPPADSRSTLLMYNKGTLAASWTFAGTDTTVSLPQAAAGDSTQFCLQIAFLDGPMCPTLQFCGPFFKIKGGKNLSVLLSTSASEKIVCHEAPTPLELSWEPDNTAGCNNPVISKHTLRILGTPYADSVVQNIMGDKYTYNIPAGSLPPGIYTAEGCAFQTCTDQSVLKQCATLTFRQLPEQLSPDYIAYDSVGLDLDTTDLVLCPNSYYRLTGNPSLKIGDSTLVVSNFSFDKNGFTTGSMASPLIVPLTFRVSGNCIYKDTLQLTTRPAYDLVADNILCVGEKDTFSLSADFSKVTWDGIGDSIDTRSFQFPALDSSASYMAEVRVRAEREGCAYRDTARLDVVKVSGQLLAWPDSSCADGIYRVALNEGVVVEGTTYPADWSVNAWSPQLYQTQARPSPGRFVVKLKAKELECRDSILLQLPTLPQANAPVDTLYHDRCATTLLTPEGCPSGTGRWYRIHRVTGELDTLVSNAPAYWRNVSDEDAAEYLYVFHCSTPCTQVAGLREAEENDGPPCPETDLISLRVVPNPSSGEASLEIRHHASETFRLQLLDLTGRPLHDERLAHPGGIATYGLDLHSLPSGVYVLMLRFPGGATQTEKLILHR